MKWKSGNLTTGPSGVSGCVLNGISYTLPDTSNASQLPPPVAETTNTLKPLDFKNSFCLLHDPSVGSAYLPMFNLKLPERVGYTNVPPTKCPKPSSPALWLKLSPWRSTMTSNYSMQCTVFCLQIQLAFHIQSSLNRRNWRENIGSEVGWTYERGNCRDRGLTNSLERQGIHA